MNDVTETVSKLDNLGVATLFELSRDADVHSPEAVQESLEHALAIPIERALNQLPPELAAKMKQRAAELHLSSRGLESAISTFGGLFSHSRPPNDMLKFAKEFGKAAVRDRRSPWPKSVCEVIYYAAYAAGLVHWHDRLGGLRKADLLTGFGQLARRPWISPELKTLFEQAAARLAQTTTES